MTWPTAAISESNLDQGSDSKANARPDLLQVVQQVNAIRESRGVAGGIPALDDSGLIPVTQINTSGILGLLQFIDGAGSGLDADLLDGIEATGFVRTTGANAIAAPSSLTAGWTIGRTTADDDARHRVATLKATNSPAATAAGYGLELRAELGNAAGTATNAGYIAWDWTDSTNASEDSAFILGHMTAGSLVEALRVVGRKVQMAEQTTPSGTPPTGSWWAYFTSAGLTIKDDAGAEVVLGGGSVTAHNSLTGLTTGDPHTQYFRPDGARPMTADFPLAAFSVLSTDLGADPSAPSAGQVKWYTKGGQLYYRNSSAVVGPIIAGGVTDHGALSGLADDDHTQYLLRQPTASVVINDSGGDFDFTIEGDTTPNLFTLNAGNNALGINVDPGSTYRMELVAGTGRRGLSITGDDQIGLAVATSAGTAATLAGAAALLTATRTVGSAPSVAAVKISDAGAAGFRLLDVDGLAATDLMRAKVGSIEAFSLLAGEAVFNNTGSNYDFRVEGDTKTSLLFIDASADAVSINGAGTGAFLNVFGDGRHGISATTTGNNFAALYATCDHAATYAIQAVAGVAQGHALYGLSTQQHTAYFYKDLQGLTPDADACVRLEVFDPTDTAHVLTIKQAGSGDFLALYDGDDDLWARFPSTGGAYWRYLAGDMATPPTGMWGIFCKEDGWFQISPAGVVSQLGAGGGSILTDGGVSCALEAIEETLTLSGTSVAMATAVPAGCVVLRVLTKVLSAVSGGFHAGWDAGDTTWGTALSGTLNATNLLDQTWSSAFPNYTARNLTLSCPSGSFPGGQVRVTVVFYRFTMT